MLLYFKHKEFVNIKLDHKTNFKYGNLTFDARNETHYGGFRFVLFRDVKNVNVLK